MPGASSAGAHPVADIPIGTLLSIERGKTESGDMLLPHPATLTAVLDGLLEQIGGTKARQVDQAEPNAPAAAWLNRALSSAPATDAVSSRSRVTAALTGDLGRDMAAEIRSR